MDHQSKKAQAKAVAIDREAEVRKFALSTVMAAAAAIAALQIATAAPEQSVGVHAAPSIETPELRP